jgi:predicted metal-binding protein
MPGKAEKITIDMQAGRLPQDLERYAQKALDLGATQAKVIEVADIPVDERVTLKCQIPRCFGYGVGAHCPPNTLKPAELREILKKYHWAVLFTLDVPPEVIVRDKATIKERVAAYQQIYQMVSELESQAFYDGHYLAFGFAAGSCRHTFCGKKETCAVMEGQRCRMSLRSRPSMEAVGIDVYHLVARQGWDIYPIGSGAKPEDMPKGVLAGLVIVQ